MFQVGDTIMRWKNHLATVTAVDSGDEHEVIYCVKLWRDGRVCYWAVATDDPDHRRVVMSFAGPVPIEEGET